MTFTICATRCCEVVLTRRGDSDQLAEFWWRRDVDGLGNQLVSPVDLGGTSQVTSFRYNFNYQRIEKNQ